jgi:hypothetical protein
VGILSRRGRLRPGHRGTAEGGGAHAESDRHTTDPADVIAGAHDVPDPLKNS